MNQRVARLRQRSLDAVPAVSIERALLLTEAYRRYEGRLPAPLLRARAFHHICARKSLYLGEDELIVGERGPAPKATPTYPEITCHSVEDLEILDSRPKTSYRIGQPEIERYAADVIPYWRGRSLRESTFGRLPAEWHQAYGAGIFTEFMEQRAPGHTAGGDLIYRRGLLDLKAEISAARAALVERSQPDVAARIVQLDAMDIAADAVILLARRYAALALQKAAEAPDPARRAELERVAAVCERVPAEPPRDLWEAIQAYWFCHLGVITELNGWDAYNPGHLDRHLEPFYLAGIDGGSLTHEDAAELLGCLWVKFNNHPAPPKVGVTAAESGTYTDFANINLGGLRRDGSDAVSEVSYLILEVVDDLHLLQPSNNVQVARANPERFVEAAARVIRKGYGFPSVFNADAVVAELVRQGKSVEDARDGGTSGCVEAGAFGREAYILTGYFNLPKLLELALHDGRDPRSGEQLGPPTGAVETLAGFEDLLTAWQRQVEHFVELKVRGNDVFEAAYAEQMPAPFLSLLTEDCIARGRDYNAGGARYNTSYIQGVGIGTLTDCMAAVRHVVFETRRLGLGELVAALDADFAGHEALRQELLNRPPKYGNDDDRADELMQRAFEVFYRAVEGRPNRRGGEYHVDMLPTTCHVYFGSVTGATPDGRRAGQPLSEGISPVQGADRRGPTAVLRSAAKMDHLRTGGTLLNLKFTPQVLEGEAGLRLLGALVRGYFALDAHHVQFNVVTADTLRRAQATPEAYRDLIVRVAGYSDYFCDISRELQDEIIRRTEHQAP